MRLISSCYCKPNIKNSFPIQLILLVSRLESCGWRMLPAMLFTQQHNSGHRQPLGFRIQGIVALRVQSVGIRISVPSYLPKPSNVDLGGGSIYIYTYIIYTLLPKKPGLRLARRSGASTPGEGCWCRDPRKGRGLGGV